MTKSLWSRGLLYTAGIAINRIIPEWLFRFRVFRVYELQCPERQADADAPFVCRRCVSNQEIRLAEQLTRFDSTDTAGHERFESYVVFDGEQPVGGVWRAVEQFDEEELGVRLCLREDQRWIFAAYVSKSHRGRGIYRQLLSALLCPDSPAHHYASINPTNRLSLAAHAAFIRSTVGTCIAIRIFRCAFAWTSGNLAINRHATNRSGEMPLEIRISRP